MRKPISVATIISPDTINGFRCVLTTVVCDDGTIWEQANEFTGWEQLTPIPQEDDE